MYMMRIKINEIGIEYKYFLSRESIWNFRMQNHGDVDPT